MGEFVVGHEVVGEDGVFLCPFNLLLAVVEGEGAEVVRLAGGDFDLDVFGLAVAAGDAIAGAEEG